MKITGIRKAVREFKDCNKDGPRSPRYGYLMLDRDTGEVWTDEFYSFGHTAWKSYRSPSVVRIRLKDDTRIESVTETNVRNLAVKLCDKWQRELDEIRKAEELAFDLEDTL